MDPFFVKNWSKESPSTINYFENFLLDLELVYKECDNNIEEGISTKIDHKFLIKMAENSIGYKNLVMAKSSYLDDFLYRMWCKYVIEANHILCKNIEPYPIDSLYTEKYSPNGKKEFFLINYAARLFFNKRYAIKRIVEDFEKKKTENPNTPFTPDASLYGLTEEELKVIVSLFYHKDKIINEMSIYGYFFLLFESNEWKGLVTNKKYMLQNISKNLDTLIKISIEEIKKTEEKWKKTITKSKNIQQKIREMEQNFIEVPRKLLVEDNNESNNIRTVLDKHKMQIDYYTNLKLHKTETSNIHLLTEKQIEYIEYHLKKIFEPCSLKSKWCESSINVSLVRLLIGILIILLVTQFWFAISKAIVLSYIQM